MFKIERKKWPNRLIKLRSNTTITPWNLSTKNVLKDVARYLITSIDDILFCPTSNKHCDSEKERSILAIISHRHDLNSNY